MSPNGCGCRWFDGPRPRSRAPSDAGGLRDGRAIADATHELRLPLVEVKNLVEALNHDLAGQSATASPRPGSPRIYDVPTTVLGVDSGSGMREVHVPSLEHAAASYDAALATARDRLARLADRVTAQGGNYSTDRVRLSSEQVTVPATPTKPLPGGVPRHPRRRRAREARTTRAIRRTRSPG